MKRLFTLLLCIVLLTSCGQKPLPPKENSPTINQTEKNVIDVQQEPTSSDQIKEKYPEEDILSSENVSTEPALQTVSIIVTGLKDNILFSASATYREGITVFDLLLETTKEKNIPVVFTGSKSSPYVTSICGISEKQHGPSSGWIYTVNGESVMTSCSKCTLNPGDIAEWKYITEF